MRLIVHTVDGKTHRSDYLSKAEALTEGDITEAQYLRRVVGVEAMLDDLGNLSRLAMEINGRRRIFNPNNVVWVEYLTEDGEF